MAMKPASTNCVNSAVRGSNSQLRTSPGTSPENLLSKEYPHPRPYRTLPHILWIADPAVLNWLRFTDTFPSTALLLDNPCPPFRRQLSIELVT
jgi:hypothetical protein